MGVRSGIRATYVTITDSEEVFLSNGQMLEDLRGAGSEHVETTEKSQIEIRILFEIKDHPFRP